LPWGMAPLGTSRLTPEERKGVAERVWGLIANRAQATDHSWPVTGTQGP
jgi:hypothetical protein